MQSKKDKGGGDRIRESTIPYEHNPALTESILDSNLDTVELQWLEH